MFLYPLLQRSWKGVYWFHLVCLSVRPSIRLSVCDSGCKGADTSQLLLQLDPKSSTSVCSWWHPFVWILLLLSHGYLLHQLERKEKRRIFTITNIILRLYKYHIKTLQEVAKKSYIWWIWRFIYGHELPKMKKTRKKKRVCGATCFIAAEIKFSEHVCLWTESCLLCIFNNTRQIHFIFTHLIQQLQVCCVYFFFFLN